MASKYRAARAHVPRSRNLGHGNSVFLPSKRRPIRGRLYTLTQPGIRMSGGVYRIQVDVVASPSEHGLGGQDIDAPFGDELRVEAGKRRGRVPVRIRKYVSNCIPSTPTHRSSQFGASIPSRKLKVEPVPVKVLWKVTVEIGYRANAPTFC